MNRIISLSGVMLLVAPLVVYAQTQTPNTTPPKAPAPAVQKQDAPPAKPAAVPQKPVTPTPAPTPPKAEPAPPKTEAAAKPESAKPSVDVRKLAENWVDRFNALSNWRISFDGQETGVNQVVDKMSELYAPNVVAEMPQTDPEQIGRVLVLGNQNLRAWFDKIARTQVNLAFIARRQTSGDVEGELVTYSINLPWGGTGISFEILANYARRADRKRFTAPGAVFLQYGPDGKINRVRMLLEAPEEVAY